MKIYFTYGEGTREGFETCSPLITENISDESVEEIQGEDVLEKVPDLIAFIDECYRILKPGAKAIFSCPFYASTRAWVSPLTRRCLSESSLGFASKDWREQVKYTEATVKADFQVEGQFAVEQSITQRADDVRAFWAQKYNNVVQAILFTLTKK